MGILTGYKGAGFSWRKMLTGLAALIFAVSSFGFLFFDLPELPNSYQVIISGIILSYFIKDSLRGTTLYKEEK